LFTVDLLLAMKDIIENTNTNSEKYDESQIMIDLRLFHEGLIDQAVMFVWVDVDWGIGFSFFGCHHSV
jgi:hypothetical protein